MSTSDSPQPVGEARDPFAVETTAPRRRRGNRSPTVPLAEFGKEPPPPPRARLNPRQVAIGVAISTVVLMILWVGVVQIGQIADAKWSKAGCVDVRAC